jgi:hypothetical protein
MKKLYDKILYFKRKHKLSIKENKKSGINIPELISNMVIITIGTNLIPIIKEKIKT